MVEPAHNGKVQSSDSAWWELVSIHSNIDYARKISAHENGDYNDLPADNATAAHFNVIYVPGVLESFADTFPVNCSFGKRHSKIREICRVLAAQWAGQDLRSDETDKFYLHDLFYNEGVTVDDSAWNPLQLADTHPTLGAEVAAFNSRATSKSDYYCNAMFGRDCFVQMVKGQFNTGGGYGNPSGTNTKAHSDQPLSGLFALRRGAGAI